jgi:hypothetical protein
MISAAFFIVIILTLLINCSISLVIYYGKLIIIIIIYSINNKILINLINYRFINKTGFIRTQKQHQLGLKNAIESLRRPPVNIIKITQIANIK